MGDIDVNEIMALLSFRNDGDIEYHDGGWQDTGVNYTVGWRLLKFIHDPDNDCFDAWYEGIKIITAGGYGYGNVNKASVKSVQPGVSSANMWIDDIQIGDADVCAVTPSQAGPMSGGVTI